MTDLEHSLSIQQIQADLHTEILGRELLCYPSVDSTNLRAKDAANSGARSGLCIVADTQTAGRGRLGRSFLSPCGNGVYMSVLLRLPLDSERTPQITAATAVGVARAIERTTCGSVGIKWVNDLYMRGKKVCGILTEANLNPQNSWAVIGIGVNLSDAEIPPQIADIAGGIVPRSATPPTREKLIAEILNQIEPLLLPTVSDAFLPEYRSRSVVLGKEVSVIRNQQTHCHGRAIAIDDSARLIVTLDDGRQIALHSDEISCKIE